VLADDPLYDRHACSVGTRILRESPPAAPHVGRGGILRFAWMFLSAVVRRALTLMAKRVLFSGSIAGHAVGYGGNTWAFLQWVLGFRRLGFEVYYVEESRGPQFFDEEMKPVPFLESASARYFHTVMERFGLGDHGALFEKGTSVSSFFISKPGGLRDKG
jgi:hypothetical protein